MLQLSHCFLVEFRSRLAMFSPPPTAASQDRNLNWLRTVQRPPDEMAKEMVVHSANTGGQLQESRSNIRGKAWSQPEHRVLAS